MDDTRADLPDFLTVEEAAALLRLSRSQAYEMTRVWRATGGRRGLAVLEFGRILRVPKAVLVRMASELPHAEEPPDAA